MVELELAAFLQLRPEQLPLAAEVFAQILRTMGCMNTYEALPREAIQWESDGSGFGFMGEPISLNVGTTECETLVARPHLSGFTAASLPATESLPWLSVALVFEDDAAAYGEKGNIETAKYTAAFGTTILAIGQNMLDAFEAEFVTSGIYFSTYAVVLEPWSHLLGEQGNLWAFDLAIVPLRMLAQFRDPPVDFVMWARNTSIVIANRVAWTRLPWTDTK